MDILHQFGDLLFFYVSDMRSRLAVLYLCSAIVIAYGVWVLSGRPKSFVAFLLPREVYTHRSNLVDVQVFLANTAFATVGLFSVLAFTPLVTVHVLNALANMAGSYHPPETTWLRRLLATAVIVLVIDFCKYWFHRVHHENRFFWPFHALHHSAEVLTPLTVTRVHPLYKILQPLLFTGAVGLAQGVMLFALVGRIDIVTIGTANAGYVLFNFFGANLRHSHIWVSYGRVLEHVLISPAQHQIHHSVDKKHHDRNYGEVFAIWDWMFGTLYVPHGREELSFGVADADGNRLPQPHPTLRAAMIGPFVEVWHELLKGTSIDPERRADLPEPARSEVR